MPKGWKLSARTTDRSRKKKRGKNRVFFPLFFFHSLSAGDFLPVFPFGNDPVTLRHEFMVDRPQEACERFQLSIRKTLADPFDHGVFIGIHIPFIVIEFLGKDQMILSPVNAGVFPFDIAFFDQAVHFIRRIRL